jgi:hypothetical protein
MQSKAFANHRKFLQCAFFLVKRFEYTVSLKAGSLKAESSADNLVLTVLSVTGMFSCYFIVT